MEEILFAVQVAIREELRKYDSGFEERLVTAMQKALDVVLSEYEDRIRTLEYDVARLLRHNGLER